MVQKTSNVREQKKKLPNLFHDNLLLQEIKKEDIDSMCPK